MRTILALLTAAVVCAAGAPAQTHSSANGHLDQTASTRRIALVGPRIAPLTIPGIHQPLRVDFTRGLFFELPRSDAGSDLVEQLGRHAHRAGLTLQLLTWRPRGKLALTMPGAGPAAHRRKASAQAGHVHIHLEHFRVHRVTHTHLDLHVTGRFTAGRSHVPVRHARVSLHWKPAHHHVPHTVLAHGKTGHDGRAHFKVRLPRHHHGHTYDFRLHFHKHGHLPHAHHDFRRRLH